MTIKNVIAAAEAADDAFAAAIKAEGFKSRWDKIAVELYVAMNEDGGWIVETDESEALSNLAENEGGYQARVVKITAMIAPPTMAEVTIDVPDDAGQTIPVEAT